MEHGPRRRGVRRPPADGGVGDDDVLVLVGGIGFGYGFGFGFDVSRDCVRALLSTAEAAGRQGPRDRARVFAIAAARPARRRRRSTWRCSWGARGG
ncbi:MAG: hypothetical protein HY906_25940, partial [Deltaproteobacteria bacterium]|nr:hypothetical protein [Deltaproteobacteria bacterium]